MNQGTEGSDTDIVFDDGASYENMMGRWSMLVGERFLEWIAPPKQARWVDVGCGNGAFTEMIVQRCQPVDVQAFDPAPAQLQYARQRMPASVPVAWHEGSAMALPLADASCDVAVMALVLFFVPTPTVGVAEMCRVVRSGGIVAAYHWDILDGGFPLAPIGIETKALGIAPKLPPSVDASTIPASTALWTEAGLKDVRTTQFTVERTFENFDAYWNSAATSNTLRPMFANLSDEQVALVKSRTQARVNGGAGPLTLSARANAICGVKA
ncbi:MAG TPA: class I SAM-dependent methyltransferase [Burkholderiaceae bacterium]|jgi:ubiquinone/menaquinone biosynthesis C-methylase UbiE